MATKDEQIATLIAENNALANRVDALETQLAAVSAAMAAEARMKAKGVTQADIDTLRKAGQL